MAVPTISSASPNSGPAAGWNVVEITGTNFRTRTPVPDDYVLDPATEYSTVRVYVDGVEARYAQAVSHVHIRALMPQYVGSPLDSAGRVVDAHAPVAVRVDNLDDAGVLIPGETAVKVAGYTYERAPLFEDGSAEDPPILRVLMAYMRLVLREVGKEVALYTHPDFSDPDNDYIKLADHPSVNLRAEEERDFEHGQYDNEPVLRARGDGTWDQYKPSRTYQIVVDVLASAFGLRNAQRLKTALVDMVMANPYLQVPADPRFSTPGTLIQFPLELTGEPRQASNPNAADIVAYSMVMRIRGVPVLLDPTERIYPISSIYLGYARLLSLVSPTVRVLT
jgi:hypothetical protein